MKSYRRIVHLSVIVSLVASMAALALAATPSFGAQLLTDPELDDIGADGDRIVHQEWKRDLAPLSDLNLDQITGGGFGGFIWPFQYVPLKLPGHKRITWSSGGLNIDLGQTFQSRGITPPPSPEGAAPPQLAP